MSERTYIPRTLNGILKIKHGQKDLGADAAVKLNSHATLTLSLAATVAALIHKIIFQLKSYLVTWGHGSQAPALQSTRLVSPERLSV